MVSIVMMAAAWLTGLFHFVFWTSMLYLGYTLGRFGYDAYLLHSRHSLFDHDSLKPVVWRRLLDVTQLILMAAIVVGFIMLWQIGMDWRIEFAEQGCNQVLENYTRMCAGEYVPGTVPDVNVSNIN